MVEVRTFFAGADSEPAQILNSLLKEEKLSVTKEKISEFQNSSEKISQGDSQSLSVVLFLELRKHSLAQNWEWIRGIRKSGEDSIFHSWLEYNNYVVDPLPGFKFSSDEFKPGDILVMDKEKFIQKTGFKVMSRKNEKQVLRWIEKINSKYSM
jgi:hypothetical protein